jgi:intracellular multiplication protein IcmV
MAVKDAFKITRKTFFNPLGWIGYRELKAHSGIIWASLKDTLTPAQPTRTETFTEAMQRLDLKEEDVHKTSNRYLAYAIMFVGIAALAFTAAFVFLIGYHSISAFILALACTAILLTYGFRYHFWHFQIKHRKLGCTFQDWWRGTPSVDKDAS